MQSCLRSAVLLLSFLASACGTETAESKQPVCESLCGIQTSEVTFCRQFQWQEMKALFAFQRYVDADGWGVLAACPKLKGFTVTIPADSNKKDFWSDYQGARVSGETDCVHKQIRVANTLWPLNSLSHEIAHVIEGCKVPFHDGWEEMGLYKAIDASQSVQFQP